MNMQRLIVALGVGLLISGGSTYLLSRKLAVHADSQRTAGLRYLAPVRPLDAGATIKAEDVEMIDWPTTAPIAGAFSVPQDLVGRTLLYPLDKGQPITEKFLSVAGAGSGLVAKIPEGMRAIALRTDEVMGVAGFLLPDTHVDVLATVHTDKNPEPETFIVLQNAQVLAAGHQIQPDPEGKPAVVTVVTLLLTPEDAERAVLASQQGVIHFVLRGGADKNKATDPPVDLGELVSGNAAPAAKAASRPKLSIPPVHPMPVYVIDTIAGDKQTTETFSGVHP
jgi:pilus assembly protein CpaB